MEQKKTLDLLFSFVCAALGAKYFTPNGFWGKHKTVSRSPSPKRRAAFVILALQVLDSSMCVSNTKYIRDGVSICPPLQMRVVLFFPDRNSCCVFFSDHISGRWKVDGYHLLLWISSDKMKQIFDLLSSFSSHREQKRDDFSFFSPPHERLISVSTWSRWRGGSKTHTQSDCSSRLWTRGPRKTSFFCWNCTQTLPNVNIQETDDEWEERPLKVLVFLRTGVLSRYRSRCRLCKSTPASLTAQTTQNVLTKCSAAESNQTTFGWESWNVTPSLRRLQYVMLCQAARPARTHTGRLNKWRSLSWHRVTSRGKRISRKWSSLNKCRDFFFNIMKIRHDKALMMLSVMMEAAL